MPAILATLAVLGLLAVLAVRSDRERVRDAGVAMGLLVALGLFALGAVSIAEVVPP